MRSLLVLCLVAVAFAAPQYNYNPAAGAGGAPAASNLAGTVAHHGGQSAPAVWNKQYFIHSAPEDDGLDGAGSNDNQSALRRNLRVLFVKAPENKGLENAALQLAKSASEDKTAVYVLTKQTDLGELQNKLSQLQDQNGNKPEVHFVKYKTPEEAEHAQQSIQGQYDQQFQGPTQVSNEGVAPVENFVGSNNVGGHNGGFGGQQAGSQNYGSVNNQYLPANIRF